MDAVTIMYTLTAVTYKNYFLVLCQKVYYTIAYIITSIITLILTKKYSVEQTSFIVISTVEGVCRFFTSNIEI